jgi:hypothetical protein
MTTKTDEQAACMPIAIALPGGGVPGMSQTELAENAVQG